MKLIGYIVRATGMSRRSAMDVIRSGNVSVNGETVTSAIAQVDANRDRITVGCRLLAPQPEVHLVLYKPRGAVCTRSDPGGRRTVHDLLRPQDRRAVTVGRLDYDTTGVLLLTTDGALAQRLMRPEYGVPRTYRVRLRGRVTDAIIERLRRGVLIDGRPTLPAEIRRLGDKPGGAAVEMTLREGRNRQIHRMAEAVGLRAAKIHRTAFGGVTLGGLAPGRWRKLDPRELASLLRLVNLEQSTR